MSQGQLALATEGQPVTVSRTTISSIERGVHLPSLDALVSLSRVLHLDPMELIEQIDLVSPPAEVRGLSSDEVRKLGDEAFWRGDYRNSLAHYDAAVKLIENGDTNNPDDAWSVAKLHLSRGVALRRCGALIAAGSAIERAIELSTPWNNLLCDAFVVRAHLYLLQDKPTLAQTAIEQAISRCKDTPAKTRSMVWAERGQIELCAGAYVEARSSLLQARKLALEADDRYHLVQIEGNLGLCSERLGQRRAAHQRFVKAIELARTHSAPAMEASWLVELGKVEFALDEPRKATFCATSALEIARPLDNLLTVFRAEVLLHRLARRSDPGCLDSRRLSFLRKLYDRVKQHTAYDEIHEFPRMAGSDGRNRDDA